MEDDNITQLMERVQLKIEGNLVRDYRASLLYTEPELTTSSVDLDPRVTKCVADTRKLLNEASDFLLEPHTALVTDNLSLGKCVGVGLQLAQRTNRLAHADSAEALNRVERMLEVQIARDIPLLLSPFNHGKKVQNIAKPKSRRRDGLGSMKRRKSAYYAT